MKKILTTAAVLMFTAPLARAADVIVSEPAPQAQVACEAEHQAIYNGFVDEQTSAEVESLAPRTNNFISYVQSHRHARHERWREIHYNGSKRFYDLLNSYSLTAANPLISTNEKLWAVHLYLRCLRFYIADQVADAPENWLQALWSER